MTVNCKVRVRFKLVTSGVARLMVCALGLVPRPPPRAQVDSELEADRIINGFKLLFKAAKSQSQ